MKKSPLGPERLIRICILILYRTGCYTIGDSTWVACYFGHFLFVRLLEFALREVVLSFILDTNFRIWVKSLKGKIFFAFKSCVLISFSMIKALNFSTPIHFSWVARLLLRLLPFYFLLDIYKVACRVRLNSFVAVLVIRVIVGKIYALNIFNCMVSNQWIYRPSFHLAVKVVKSVILYCFVTHCSVKFSLRQIWRLLGQFTR